MAKFRFLVSSPKGKARRGTVTEATLADARASLQKAGFTVVELFEEADIVIQEQKRPSGKTQFKPKRARIIDFELTPAERVGEFFSTYILRREVALLLLVAGLCWMAVAYVNKEPPPKPIEATLYDLKLKVQVDLNSLPGDRLILRLPEIPYSQETRVSSKDEGSGPTLELDFQLEKDASKLEIELLDGETIVGKTNRAISTGPNSQSIDVTLEAVSLRR